MFQSELILIPINDHEYKLFSITRYATYIYIYIDYISKMNTQKPKKKCTYDYQFQTDGENVLKANVVDSHIKCLLI